MTAVTQFLSNATPREVAKVMRVIGLLEEFGQDLGMPHSRHLGAGLLELRVRGSREIRIMYCFYEDKAFLLTAFVKKA